MHSTVGLFVVLQLSGQDNLLVSFHDCAMEKAILGAHDRLLEHLDRQETSQLE